MENAFNTQIEQKELRELMILEDFINNSSSDGGDYRFYDEMNASDYLRSNTLSVDLSYV